MFLLFLLILFYSRNYSNPHNGNVIIFVNPTRCLWFYSDGLHFCIVFNYFGLLPMCKDIEYNPTNTNTIEIFNPTQKNAKYI